MAGEEVCRFPRPVRSIWTVLEYDLISVFTSLVETSQIRTVWVSRNHATTMSWDHEEEVELIGREEDPSQSRERLALWQKKELEGLAWEKNPPLMESILRNLVSLPMSGRMPRNMSALAPC